LGQNGIKLGLGYFESVLGKLMLGLVGSSPSQDESNQLN